MGNKIIIYKISKSNKPIKDFAKLISKATLEIHKGILIIKDHKFKSKDFFVCYKRLHDLEEEGDKIHIEALKDLMNGESLEFKVKDPLSIIKWKEIIEDLEEVLDKCEDIAIVFDRLRIKYI